MVGRKKSITIKRLPYLHPSRSTPARYAIIVARPGEAGAALPRVARGVDRP